MLLVAIPVIAMSGASVVVRSTIETNEQAFERLYGTADAVVFPDPGAPPADGTIVIPTLPDLPAGTDTTTFVSTFSSVRALIDGDQVARFVYFTDIDLNNPITSPVVTISAGRAPRAPGEVLLAPELASEFGVAIGERLRLVRPGLELTVVGFGQNGSSSEAPLMVVEGFDRELFRAESVGVETLVDLPDSLTSDEREVALGDLVRTGQPTQRSDEAYYYDGTSVSARQLAWGWVAGVLGFVAVGIVIAAAFATSARRQLITIGQLASNGATPGLVRRTMGLQGMLTGLLGAVAGIALAVGAGLLTWPTTLLDRLTLSPIGDLRFAPLDFAVIVVTAVVAATMAALVPARSAARIPVLSALAGRRPVAQPPSWLAPTGVASFVAGLVLLAFAASVDGVGDLVMLVAVFGGLAVVFGMVCASPLIVSAVAAVGGRRGGVIRLAARSLGRTRARSAAVLTAIATVGTIAVIASTVVASTQSIDRNSGRGDNLVDVSYVSDAQGAEIPADADGRELIDPAPVIAPRLPDFIRRDIERVLPGATWTPITTLAIDPDVSEVEGVVLADEGVEELAEFDNEQLVELDRTGVLVLTPNFGNEITIATLGDSITVDVSGSLDLLGPETTPSGDVIEGPLNFGQIDPARRISDVFVSSGFVAENGLTVTLANYRLDNPDDITRDEYLDLGWIQSAFREDAFVASASAPGFESDRDGSPRDAWYTSAVYPSSPVPWTLIRVAVAAASLLLVLAVVAIGLSLAATESRDERDVLLAVGASPSTLRRVAAAKAWVLTTGAGLTAVPVGYITIFVIIRATGANDLTAPFPFAVAAGLVLVIPAVAWLMTLATSAIAQRFRPVTAATVTAE